MGRVGGAKLAGAVLALLLAVSVVSALALQSEPDRESQRERERRERERERREREREMEPEADRREHMRRGRRHGGGGERMRELQMEEPMSWLSSEGGELRVWDSHRALEDANVYVQSSRFTLRERGLVLPNYDDAACIGYVEEGEGLVGYLTGYSLGEKVKRVRRGDVVAFPRGVAHWWYNSGNQEMRIIAMADTSAGLRPGDVTVFSLVGGRRGGEQMHGRGRREGGQEMGGILHGFRKEFLAEAWNMDESEVEELLDSQRAVGIVRAEREIDVRRMARDDEQEQEQEQDNTRGSMQHCAGGLMAGEFVYNVRHGTPDVMVEDAGHATVVNMMKLPVLQHVNLGMSYGRLERDAILAPHWSPTGHRVCHFLRGSGCMEIVGMGGEQMVSQEVREGDVYVIPRFHPAGMRAGEEGLEWISFYTTNMPYVEAMAGKTSVYKNLPLQVAAAAFNMDEDRLMEFRSKRLRSAILLPPHGRRQHRRRDGEDGADVDVAQPESLGVAYM